MQVQKSPQPLTGKNAEQILVVKRARLFPDGAWHGLKAVHFDDYFTLIQAAGEFHARGLMEEDQTFKQIIPYLVFEHGGKYFLMQRAAQASETRLQSKFSLGIGGHIRQEDMISAGSIFEWALREFHEEVNYTGSLTIEPIGVLNDDSNAVGQVHIGFVFVLHGDSADISVKSELHSGELLSLDECAAYADNLETWSSMVFDFLKR